MNRALKNSFETLLKNREYAEAEKLLVAYMEENPEDWDAKLLYGTCRMMQGDSSTAKQIHDEVEPQISESNDISETQKTFWQKYKKLIIYGAIGTALVYGGYKVYEYEITQIFGVLTLCERRLCKVDTDHEWRDNPYSPGRCSRCGRYASGSLYICVICGKTKSNVSLPCGGCDDSANMICSPDVEETLE